MTTLMIIVCLIKAKMGINDENMTKAIKVISIIESIIDVIIIIWNVANGMKFSQALVLLIICGIVLALGLNIKKIQIEVLNNYFRGE